MKSLLALVVLLVMAATAWAQCPGGVCPVPAEPVKQSVLVSREVPAVVRAPVVVTRAVVRRRPVRRVLARLRVFRRCR